jgi:limonene-1,2-epoxide hydrolase
VSGLGEGLESITLNIRHMGVIDGVLYMERLDEFVIRGRPGSAPVVGVLEFEGPLIKVWREYYDRNHLLKAMGLVEDFDQKTR